MSRQLKRVLTIYISGPPSSSCWAEGDPYVCDRIFAKRLEVMSGNFISIPKENELFSPVGDEGRKYLICIRTGLEPPAGYDAAIIAAHGQRAKPTMISRDKATKIAIAEAQKQQLGFGVKAIMLYSEISGRLPIIYGVNPKNCWIAYITPSRSQTLDSSNIVVVDSTSGLVLYAGNANDEG